MPVWKKPCGSGFAAVNVDEGQGKFVAIGRQFCYIGIHHNLMIGDPLLRYRMWEDTGHSNGVLRNLWRGRCRDRPGKKQSRPEYQDAELGLLYYTISTSLNAEAAGKQSPQPGRASL